MTFPDSIASYAHDGLAHLWQAPADSPFHWLGYTAQGTFCAIYHIVSTNRQVMPIAPGYVPRGTVLSLASLARAGGYARIVWDNGGEIGVLCSARIANATGDVLPWHLFEPAQPAKIGGVDMDDWLMLHQA